MILVYIFILLHVLFFPFTCTQHMFIWDMCWAGVLIQGILAASKWGFDSILLLLLYQARDLSYWKKNGKHYSYLGTRCPPGAGSPYFMSVNQIDANVLFYLIYTVYFRKQSFWLIPKKNGKHQFLLGNWVPTRCWFLLFYDSQLDRC